MILYRYIIRKQILPFLYSLSIIVFLFMMQLVVQILSKILYKGLDLTIILEIVLINMAWMIVLAVPMAVMVTTLMTFGRMSANNEILAIKASGQNLFYLLTPIIAAAMLLTLSLIFFHNLILPDANHRSASLMQDISRKKPAALIEPNILIKDFDNYAMIVDAVDHQTGMLSGVKIFSDIPGKDPYTMIAQNGTIQLTQNEKYLQLVLFNGEYHQKTKKQKNEKENYIVVTFKKHIIYIPNVDSRLQRTERNYRGDREKSAQALLADIKNFNLNKKTTIEQFNASLLPFVTQGSVFDSLRANDTINLPPPIGIDSIQTFQQWEKAISNNPAATLAHFTKHQRVVNRTLDQLKRQDIKISQYLVEVHKKFSTSFACIVFVFIGVPLGIMARQGSMAVGASYSIFFFILYWIFLIGGERLADKLIISPALAMWSCNGIIGFFGLILIIKMVRESTFITYEPFIRLWQKIWVKKEKVSSKSRKDTFIDPILALPKNVLNRLFGTLPSYLIRKFFMNLFGVFAGLIIIITIIDYISNLRKFEMAYFPDILLYYWYYLAFFLQLIFPIGILLASMFSMTSLAIHSELTAIKASGMSVRRLTFALLFIGLGLSFFNFFLGEKILPYANSKRNEIRQYMKTGEKYYKSSQAIAGSRDMYRNFYYFGNKNTSYHFNELISSSKTASGIRRERFDRNRIVENISASQMIFTDENKWSFVKGERKSFQNGKYALFAFDTLADSILKASPKEMVVPIKSIEEMSYWELKNLLEKAQKRGEKISVFTADLHFKIALPFLNFIVMLLGLSVTARVGRKGGTVSFGIGLTLVFSYWIISQLILALGKNETIDPALAAWAGNILYLIIGLFLYRRASK